MQELFTKLDKQKKEFIPVDQWVPSEEDRIFKTIKGALKLPVSQYYGIVEKNESFDTFVLSTKRCYNGENMLMHMPLYLNYFEKFYDKDHELLMVLYKIKYLIDYQKDYTKEMFFADLNRYIMSETLMIKAHLMNNDNYSLNLDSKKYRNDKNPALQYSDRHAKILMWMSLIINMMIPLLTHFIYVNRINYVNQFLLEEYDYILSYIDKTMGVDIYTKLYSTANSNVMKNSKDNAVLWEMQDIRSIDPTTHSIDSVNNILLNIIPKYEYNRNIIFLNYTSIRKSAKYQVTGIGYEFNYVSLSNSKRDIENNSEFDKFESYLVKQNESLYLQNKCQAEKTLEYIEYMYGPFDNDEIEYYEKRLLDENGEIINSFQKNLIFYLFYRYFGDPVSAYAINKQQYIKLIIAAKRKLMGYNLVVLPYIISSKVERLQTRKCINKKELLKLEGSKYYQQIKDKYKSEKIEKHILSIIATILASDFKIIDFEDKSIDGYRIKTESLPDLICEEVLMYVTLI